MKTPPFAQMVKIHRGRKNLPIHDRRLLALDPGGTTGYALFTDLQKSESGQIDTSSFPLAIVNLSRLLGERVVDHIACEDYRVYDHKSDDHKWSDVHTVRVIGCILTLAYQKGITVSFEMAQQPKTFCTDDKLKDWGFYDAGQRHARDAVRHACYWIMFNDPTKK
jgi:hypothetical protein